MNGTYCSSRPMRIGATTTLKNMGTQQYSTNERVLQSYTGQLMPNTQQLFRLNWASLGASECRGDDGTDYTIFVGNLAADVTDYVLQGTFRSYYSSIKGAKVVTDRATGHSKGYGFVRFGNVNDQARALTEMNGTYCSSRPMRIGAATTKKNMGTQQYSTNGVSYSSWRANSTFSRGRHMRRARWVASQGDGGMEISQGQNDQSQQGQ